jgi:hypothetical protein
MDPRGMDQRREFDPLLDREWRDAVEQADRRLAGASGPLDCIGGAEPMVIRRGPGGKLRLVRAGRKRWSRPVEERFFATLATCGNIAASARAVGFCPSTIDQRRRKFPDFKRKMEEALDDAEVEIEFRLAAEVLARTAGPQGQAGAAATDSPGPFDLDAAMRFLKWREEKRLGRSKVGRNGREAARARNIAEIPIETVRDEILRRLDTIRRHRRRQSGQDQDAGEGWNPGGDPA